MKNIGNMIFGLAGRFAILTVLATSVYAISPQRIAVYLVGGQSNALGLADPSGLTPEQTAPLTNVLFYTGSGALTPLKVWEALQPGSGNTAGQFGPEVLFGRTMHERVGSAGTQIALIKYADGGTSLSTNWFPGGNATTNGDGPVYISFQKAVTSGLTALTNLYPGVPITLEGMIWQQGERDIVVGTTNGYQTNLFNFIADIRATYGTNLPFVLGQISDHQTSLNAAGRQVVKAAQAAIATSNSLNGLVITDDLAVNGDHLHFSAAGQIALGERFASAMLKLPLTDANTNGMDDAWEIAHWGATGQNPNADPDGDGRNNLEEFLWNTDPLVSDGPRPAISRPVGGAITASWNVRPARRYLLETSTNLQTWTRVDSFMPAASSGTNSVTFKTAGGGGFYRIGVQH